MTFYPRHYQIRHFRRVNPLVEDSLLISLEDDISRITGNIIDKRSRSISFKMIGWFYRSDVKCNLTNSLTGTRHLLGGSFSHPLNGI